MGDTYNEWADIATETQARFPTKRFEAETLDLYCPDGGFDPGSRSLLETFRKESEADHSRIQKDGNYIIVNEEVSDDKMKKLFDDTKKLRQEKQEKSVKEKEEERQTEARPVLADHLEEGAMGATGQSSGAENPEIEESYSGNTLRKNKSLTGETADIQKRTRSRDLSQIRTLKQ